jgi:hypothetical protein
MDCKGDDDMSSVYGGPADVKLENELSEPEDDLDWGTSKTSDDYQKFRQIQFHMYWDARSRTIQEPDNIDMTILHDLKPEDLLVVYFDTRNDGVPGLTADVIREVMRQLSEKYKCKVIALPYATMIAREDKETFKKRLQSIIEYLDN